MKILTIKTNKKPFIIKLTEPENRQKPKENVATPHFSQQNLKYETDLNLNSKQNMLQYLKYLQNDEQPKFKSEPETSANYRNFASNSSVDFEHTENDSSSGSEEFLEVESNSKSHEKSETSDNEVTSDDEKISPDVSSNSENSADSDSESPNRNRKSKRQRKKKFVAYHIVTDDNSESETETENENENNKFVAEDADETAIFIPKRSTKYIDVDVDRNGLGILPKFHVADGLFTADCFVEAVNNKARIFITNTSNHSFDISFPRMKLEAVEDYEENENIEPTVAKMFTLKTTHRFERLQKSIKFNKNLNSEELKSINALLNEFSDVFFLQGDKLNENSEFKHKIELVEGAKPVKLKPYRIPEALQAEMNRNIQEMLDSGTIGESNSPWNLPVFLVPKKTIEGKKKFRLVVDMRRLNELIVQDVYPLPLIDELLGQLGKAEYFSTVDLYSGFFQLGLDEESQKFTSFTALGKKLEFKKLVMGLKNAPAFFTRVLQRVLTGLVGTSCLIYLDDIVVFGTSLAEHNDNLRKVFDALRLNELKLQPDKCNFLQKEVLFLGHKVTTDGVEVDDSKFDGIKNFPIPKTRKDVRSFLGLTGYYRKFIQDYGKIAAPLNKLTSVNVQFRWTDVEQIAFDNLKEKMMNPPVLIFPDFAKPFVLTTDASGEGLGAVLSQMENKNDRPVAYASRAMSEVEKRKLKNSAFHMELLAISWGVKKFRHYLYGRHFTIFTDHQPLVHFKNMANDNSAIMKLKLELEEYDFDIKYKPGKINANADALSRCFLVVSTDDDEKQNLMKEFHTSKLGGHRAFDKTVEKIKSHGYTWNKINQDVKNFIKHCKSCQSNKLYKKSKFPMTITDTPSYPWEKCCVDIVGPLPKTVSQNEYILTFQCNFTKFILTIPLKTQSATEVAEAMVSDIILRFGIPKVILSDQGANFMSKVFRNFCSLFQIRKIRTSAYHPQSNGSLERFHRTLKEYLRHFIDNNQDNWDDLLKFAEFAHNNTKHNVTGFHPSELVFGRKMNVPSSIMKPQASSAFYSHDDFLAVLRNNLKQSFKIAAENLTKTKVTQKKRHDNNLNVPNFQIGDAVLLLNETARQGRSKKLGPQWVGPYTIIDKIGDINFKIKMGKTIKVVHGDKLKNFY